MDLNGIKTHLRNGPYAWPGGYPMFFQTADGGVLSHKAVRENWREVVHAHLTNALQGGWYVAGAGINWEDPELYCDHTGERIESAYADN